MHQFARRMLLLCAWLSGLASPSFLLAGPGAFHTITAWDVKPSQKYDALCLLNVLSGDPYYLRYYQAQFDHFHPLFTAKENAAFVELKRVLKDEGGGIVSARLALYYSVVKDETLLQMIRTAHDSHTLQAALKRTPYWNSAEWNTYEAARPSLETALRALHRVSFASYWRREAEPAAARRAEQLKSELRKFDIVPAIERRLGFALPSQTISVYLLTYSEPHGIRITGSRFLTHRSYPFSIVLHNAIHEMMHPPYDASDPGVERAVGLLSSEPMIVDKVKHHDQSFGYNTAAGYIEEDSVQALEQIVSEQFGVGRDADKYWREQDGGMHVLAAVIYNRYKAALKRAPEAYGHWFIRAVEEGELRGDRLQANVDVSNTPPR